MKKRKTRKRSDGSNKYLRHTCAALLLGATGPLTAEQMGWLLNLVEQRRPDLIPAMGLMLQAVRLRELRSGGSRPHRTRTPDAGASERPDAGAPPA